MDLIEFENHNLPIYLKEEDITHHIAHSEMAHSHDHIELVVIERGSLTCNTGGKEFILHKGDVCFINRKHLHQLYSNNKEESKHIVMIIGTSFFSCNSSLYEKYVLPILEDKQFSHIRFEDSSTPAGQIYKYVNEANKLLKEKAPGYELDLVSIIYKIIYQLYLAYITKSHTLSHIDINLQIQQQMVDYIYSHYSENITLDDIAASGNISRSQCAKLFNRYTSLSPINFLNKHRLEISRELLRTTYLPIGEIALSCGFSDQSYFNRLFVKQYGITPFAYRKGT